MLFTQTRRSIMNFYRYDPDADAFDGFQLRSSDRNIISIRNERGLIAESWRPIQVDSCEDNPGSMGDFPSLSDYRGIPIFSERAWSVLMPLIKSDVEALSITHSSGTPFLMIHVTAIIDALDLSRAIVTRNRTTQRVSFIDRYAFHSSRIEGKHIFRLPTESSGELIVDELFRDTVKEHRLKGLLFNQLQFA
jgi:hypothetical protein